jgi:hypothetical protein
MRTSRKSLAVTLTCVLCLCGFATASASAANVTIHSCTFHNGTAGAKYTANTCSPGTRNDITGEWTWFEIIGSTTANVSNASASSLAATVGGVKFKIACSGLNGGGTAENSSGKILGSGIVLHYTGCSVTEPSGGKCTVASELTTNTLKAESNEMKVKYEPSGSTPFITIAVSGASCPEALKGNKEVTGQATAEVPEGAIEEFTSTSGSALKYAGQAATYLGNNGLVNGSGEVLGAVT